MTLPIRVRLTLIFTVGSAALLVAFGALVYLRMAQDLLDGVDFGLRARADNLTAGIARDGLASLGSSGNLVDADETLDQVLDAQGKLVASSRRAATEPMLGAADLAAASAPVFFVRTIPGIDMDPLRILAVPLSSPGASGHVLLAATLGDRQDALAGLLASLAVGGPVALLLMSWAAWLLVGGSLGPVERMRIEAEAVSSANPERRLSVPPSRDELARLATTLNTMLARLHQALTREHRFVDDASHELRTPLSVLRTELDLALRRARTTDELQAALVRASQETDRLVRLAEDLLVLARARAGRLPVRRERLDVAALVAAVELSYVPRAARSGSTLTTDVRAPTAAVDPARLRQILENLLDNAIRHTPPGGVIRLTVSHEYGTLQLAVEDTGPGFPADVIERAFEPFALGHGDGGTGGTGTGLGLAIVEAIAQAHGGRARAERTSAGGARVSVSLRDADVS